MESDFRSMVTFRPSSMTRRFSSRVPNSDSMLGVISMFFFMERYRSSPARRRDEARAAQARGFGGDFRNGRVLRKKRAYIARRLPRSRGGGKAKVSDSYGSAW